MCLSWEDSATDTDMDCESDSDDTEGDRGSSGDGYGRVLELEVVGGGGGSRPLLSRLLYICDDVVVCLTEGAGGEDDGPSSLVWDRSVYVRALEGYCERPLLVDMEWCGFSGDTNGDTYGLMPMFLLVGSEAVPTTVVRIEPVFFSVRVYSPESILFGFCQEVSGYWTGVSEVVVYGDRYRWVLLLKFEVEVSFRY